MLLFLLVFFFAVNRASVGGFEGFDDVHQMPFGRSDMTATLFAPELFDDDLGARIYLVGGCAADQECPTDWGGWCFCPELTARCEYYSPDQDIWVNCASAPRERYRFAAAEVNGKLYIVGGRDVMDQIVTEVDVYDPVSDTWATPYVWEDATSDNGVFADGDDLYLVGGYDQNYTVAHNSLTKLSTIDFIAETLSSMSMGRGDLGVISVPESDGSSSHYAIGGAGVDFCTMLNTVESYDIASDTWIILGVLTLPRADMALGVIDSELFVIAGETKDDSCDYSIFNPGESIPVSDVERFVQGTTTTSSFWVVEEEVPNERFRFVGASYNGKIYLFGGQSELVADATVPYYAILDTTMLYVPKSIRDANGLEPEEIAGLTIGIIVVCGALGAAVLFYISRAAYLGYSKASSEDDPEAEQEEAVPMNPTEPDTKPDTTPSQEATVPVKST